MANSQFTNYVIPTTLDVPENVILQHEELASSLAVLSHRLLVEGGREA